MNLILTVKGICMYVAHPISGRKHKGKYFLIDQEDVERVSQKRWYLNSQGYVFYLKEGENTTSLSRFLTDCEKGLEVNYKDGNKLNNSKENLRKCTPGENRRHIGSRKRKSASGYIGVKKKHNFQKAKLPYYSIIYHNKSSIALGCFACPKEAAKAYDRASLYFHGEFGNLNFPKLEETYLKELEEQSFPWKK